MGQTLGQRIRSWLQRFSNWLRGDAATRVRSLRDRPAKRPLPAPGGARGEAAGFRKKLDEARRNPGPYRKP